MKIKSAYAGEEKEKEVKKKVKIMSKPKEDREYLKRKTYFA